MAEVFSSGKTLDEMTIKELRQSLVHFRDALQSNIHQTAHYLRRMEKMEEALTKEQLRRLDAWLYYHQRDVEKGDGTEYWVNWQSWEVPSYYKGNKA